MPEPIIITFEVDASKVDGWIAERRGKPIVIPVQMEPAEKGTAAAGAGEAVPGAAEASAATKAAAGIVPPVSGLGGSTFAAMPAGAMGSSYGVPDWMMRSLGTASPAIAPAPVAGVTATIAAATPQPPIFSLGQLFQASQVQPSVTPLGAKEEAAGPVVVPQLPDFMQPPMPSLGRKEMERNYARMQKAGLVEEIAEGTVRDKYLAKDLAQSMQAKLPADDPNTQPTDFVMAVRTKLGIPSQRFPEEFAAYRDKYLQAFPTPPAKGTFSSIAPPLVASVQSGIAAPPKFPVEVSRGAAGEQQASTALTTAAKELARSAELLTKAATSQDRSSAQSRRASIRNVIARGSDEGRGGEGGGASGESEPTGGDGGPRIFGLRAGGIGRYLGAVFLARELTNVAQAKSEYDFQQQLSGGQPGAQLRNEQNYFQRASGGFVGGIVGQLVDPLGVEQNKIRLTAETAQSDEEFAFQRLHGQGVAMTAQGHADVSGMIGFRQQIEEAKQRYYELDRQLRELRGSGEFQADVQKRVDIRKVEIEGYYDERKTRLQKELYQQQFDQPGVQGRMFRQMTDAQRLERIRPALESGVADLEAQKQTQISNEGADIRKKAEAPIQAQLDAAERIMRNTQERLQYQEQQNVLNTRSESEMLRYEMQPGGATREGLREMQMERINREADFIQSGATKPGVGEAYRQREAARIDLGDFQFNRRVERERFSIQAHTDRVGVEGGIRRSPLRSEFAPGPENIPTRRIESEILDVVNATESQRRQLIEEYGGTEAERRGLLHANAVEGRTRVSALQRQLTESQHGEEINPFIQSTSGIGTLNMGIIQQELKAAFNRVGSESRSLPGEGGGAGDGRGGPSAEQVSQIQQQGQQIAQGVQQVVQMLQKLNLQVA